MDSATAQSLRSRSPLIFWVDEQARVRRANATALAVLGLSAEELVGRPMSSLLTEESRERLERTKKGTRLLVELERTDGPPLRVTYAVHKKDNLSVHTATPLGDASLEELIEERIREARRAAHCELLGHISHNVNNLLTTILSPAQLLLESTHDPDAREDIIDILQATQRARALLREMYRAVRFEPETTEGIRLDALLSTVATHPPTGWLTVRLDLAERLPRPLGVTDGLRTILHTLLSNATEAGATEVLITTRADDERVYIDVSDNGSGIEPELLSRLFEPFATNKPRVGAGLSLATTRTRLQGWGGSISVQSTLRQGSTFTVALQHAPRPVAAPPARGRVLLVEDERPIARALTRIFSHHDIDTAYNATDALQLFAENTYDAVLIDLGLPEMSGDELAEALDALDPDVTMLLLTGWVIGSDDPRMQHFDGRIQKPIDDLAAVRRTLQDAIQRTRDRRS